MPKSPGIALKVFFLIFYSEWQSSVVFQDIDSTFYTLIHQHVFFHMLLGFLEILKITCEVEEKRITIIFSF